MQVDQLLGQDRRPGLGIVAQRFGCHRPTTALRLEVERWRGAVDQQEQQFGIGSATPVLLQGIG